MENSRRGGIYFTFGGSGGECGESTILKFFTKKIKKIYLSFHKKIGIALLLLVITFPVIRPGFSLQIDPQIHWVFNYLWQNDFSKTQHLIFPHGPLTFINFPLAMGDNLFWGVLFNALLRLFFIYTFLHLSKLLHPKNWWIFSFVLFFILEFMDLEFIISAAVANLLFLNYFSKKKYWFWLALILATLGFYIKMSIGIISFSMVVPFVGFLFFEKIVETKKISITHFTVLLRILGIPFLLLMIWFLMYQNLEGFGTYFHGVLELVKGNSDSASLYPDNHWGLLGLCFLSFLSVFFLSIWQVDFEKRKNIILVYTVLGFSIFAVWKHGMAREDPWHIIKIFGWLLVFFSYVLLFIKPVFAKNKNRFFGKTPLTIFLMSMTLLLFYGNIKWSVGLFVEELGTDGNQNFTTAFLNQKEFFEENKNASLERIEVCKMNSADLQLIDNQTVDCYPWNYAFIAANNLNWQPRPVIQSYAAYTPWLDQQNAQHFSSKKAPQFLIWETDILKRDIWEGELTSIDNRYLLNDEPQTIAGILTHYKVVEKRNAYILLQKNESPFLSEAKIENSEKYAWEEWIEVPYFGDGILRAQFQFEGTFLKWLKAKTYKDEPLFIEYELENGDVRKYRFTAENAKEGLWINPFITRLSGDEINPITTKIRFSCGNNFLVENEIQVAWQFFPIEKSSDEEGYKSAFEYFGKGILANENVLVQKNEIALEEINLASGDFSPAYELQANEIFRDSTQSNSIAASVQTKMSYHGKALLVIILEKDGEAILWEAKSVENFMTIFNKWETAFFKRKIPNVNLENAALKVYVWNTGKEDILIKNLKLKILEKSLTESK